MTAAPDAAATPPRSRAVLVWLLIAVSAAAAVLLSLRSLVVVPEIWQGDFLSYLEGARRVLAGQPLYPAFQLQGPYYLGGMAFGVGFVYPPPAVLVTIPLAGLPDDLAFAIFATACVLLLGSAVHAVCRREGLSRTASALVTVAFMLTAPVIECIATGQANAFVAIGLGWMWLRPELSGYVSGIGALLKVFPGAGFFWTYRKRAPLLRPILLTLAIVAVSVAVFGVGPWVDFVTSLAYGQPTNFAYLEPPRHWLQPFLGGTIASLVSYALAGVALLATLRIRDDAVAFLVLGIAMILPAPDWYVHYLVIPLMAALPLLARTLAGALAARRAPA